MIHFSANANKLFMTSEELITMAEEAKYIHAFDMQEVAKILTDDPDGVVLLHEEGALGNIKYQGIRVTYDPARNGGCTTPEAAMTRYGSVHYDSTYLR